MTESMTQAQAWIMLGLLAEILSGVLYIAALEDKSRLGQFAALIASFMGVIFFLLAFRT